MAAWWNPFRREVREELVEAAAGPARTAPPRQGFEFGISQQGLTEYNQGTALSGTDRRQLLTHLYEAYLACPWSWASVNAIARRITAGDLQMDWDPQDGQDPTEDRPDKPKNVLAFERLLAYCNQRENIRQLIRGIVSDLLVFGDAYVEVVWMGQQPVALYSLDAPSMLPLADEHGRITGYVQITEHYQRAEFEPREVIHVSLDSPRSGVFGVSPTYAALLPITAWLFSAATLKETYRKGNPLSIHVDLPGSADSQVWLDQYMARNIGPRGIGRPIVTKNGGKVGELGRSSIVDLLQTLDQRRDEIVAAYGVPPAQVGIIESGNLGGGTGESQQKTFEIMTCDPIANLILEALYFHLGVQGFGIEGWKLKFGDVDLRDSEVVEGIREKRLQNGAWSLNRYRADIGEPPVDGGEDPVLMGAATSNIIRIRDLDASAKASIAKQVVGTGLEIKEPGGPEDPIELIKAKEQQPPNQPPPPPGDGPGGGPGGQGPRGPFGPPQPTDDAQGDDEEDDPEETSHLLPGELALRLTEAGADVYLDETGQLWEWSDGEHRFVRAALAEGVAEELADAGAEQLVDEAGELWAWAVEEARYVRTAAGAKHYGQPVGSLITNHGGKPGGSSGGKGTIKFGSQQHLQKKTADAYFGPSSGGPGASYPGGSSLTVTDAAAAAAHLETAKNAPGLTSGEKIAITALKKKLEKLGGGDSHGDGTPSPAAAPAPAAKPKPATPAAPIPPATPGGPVDTTGWAKVGGQKGSNPGGTYQSPDGTQHYVKQSKSPKHARNEVLAANLYKLAGIDHSDLGLATVDGGKLGTAAPIVPGAKQDLATKIVTDPAYKAKVQDGFGVDAWLANWDVAGATHDNIVTDAKGQPVRIDPGGALLFRAQGSPKGDEFGDTAGEWDSMRSSGKNPQAASLFAGMSDAQLKASAQKVVAITPEQIDAEIAKAGFDGPDAALLSQRLKARRADVAKRAGISLPEAGDTTPTPDKPATFTGEPEDYFGKPDASKDVPAPTPSTQHEITGKIAFTSKQKTQKKTANTYFGAGAGNVGASFDGDSVLTVHDPAAAIAALDKGLASKPGPGAASSIKAVKSKIEKLAGWQAAKAENDPPSTPAPTPSSSTASPGTAAPSAPAASAPATPGAAPGEAPVKTTSGAAALLGGHANDVHVTAAKQLAATKGEDVYLLASMSKSGPKTIPSSQLDKAQAKGATYVKVTPTGQLFHHAPLKNGGVLSSDEQGTDALGLSKHEPDLWAAAKADAASKGTAYVAKNSSGSAILAVAGNEEAIKGKPYVKVANDGALTYHTASSYVPKADSPGSGQIPQYSADDLQNQKDLAKKITEQYREAAGNNLAAGEKAAIKSYSGSGYHQINGNPKMGHPGLRHPPPSEAAQKHIDQLDQAVKKWALPHEMTVWRGTGDWDPPAGALGSLLEDPGWISTSMTAGTAFGGTRMEITVPKGFNAIPVNGTDASMHPNEIELLLPRGTRFMVLADETKGGQRWLKMQALPPAAWETPTTVAA